MTSPLVLCRACFPPFLLCLWLAAWLAGAPPAGASEPIRFALVGDSTVAKEQGWGNAFLARLTAGATGANFGHNGASSKSYRAMGDWQRVLAYRPTHILIQFGHNDMPGKGPERETDAATTFRENLARYVQEARAAGAQPILVTSLVRRTFQGEKLEDLLIPYAEATQAVATQLQVPLVDLHERSRELVERLGPQGSAPFSPPGKDGQKDLTHLTAQGGQTFAGLVIEELSRAVPALAGQFAATPAAREQKAWYVAPTGDDQAAGTLEQPFATLQRAQDAVSPGETVYVRGGTYRPTEAQIARRQRGMAYLTFLDKSGTPGEPIIYRAYREERPVFDCSLVKPDRLRVDAFFIAASWLHLQGLEVTGVQVSDQGHTQSICFENNGSHNIYEGLRMHDGQAIGFYTTRGSENLILNCDAWNNWDYTSENGKGGNVDGFGGHPTKGSTGNIFRGCRAWYNSDDGFDCINAHEAVTFDHCWAFSNGLNAKQEKLGDGNGFKAGGYGTLPAARLPQPIPRHVVKFCVAVGNRASGFYGNHHPGGSDWWHNSAYRNGTNFSMLGRLLDNVTDIDGIGHVLKNNLSYRGADLRRFDAAQCEAAGNTFTTGLKLTDRDFISLDEKELTVPRQPSGALPEIAFLHLAPESAALDRGVDLGLPYQGKAPDPGAFEHPSDTFPQK